jgi:glycerol-3-phosphate dehydrogenase (NAD(P)+)
MAALRGHRVLLWCRREEQARSISSTGHNPDYLEGTRLHPNLRATADLREAAAFSRLWVAAVPTQALRGLLETLAPLAPAGRPSLCCLAKGIEIASGRTGEGIAEETMPRTPYTILSGPCLAEEVARGLPTAVVTASRDPAQASAWQDLLGGPAFRIYTSDDVIGVEIGGAVKNVVAVAVGIARGMDLGDNAAAALATRGLAEILRLGTRMGANPLTLTGLAGVGDLMVTCYGISSRNFRLGLAVGGGTPVETALRNLRRVAEGYHTVRALRENGSTYGVDLPVADGVHRILHEGASPRAVMEELLLRDPKPELSAETP